MNVYAVSYYVVYPDGSSEMDIQGDVNVLALNAEVAIRKAKEKALSESVPDENGKVLKPKRFELEAVKKITSVDIR